MSPSPEEVADGPKVEGADVQDAPAPAPAPADAAPQPTPETAAPTCEGKDARPGDLLLYTVFALLCTGVALWLIFAWAGYKHKYSQQTEGWYLGSTKMIEITLVREDKKNLACSSEKMLSGVHCGYHGNQQPWGPGPGTDPHALQPFNTVKNELFLGAGLWQSPVLRGTLPSQRFTVVCNYHVLGVLKSVSLRWSATGAFNPVDQSVAVGTLTDCVIPQ